MVQTQSLHTLTLVLSGFYCQLDTNFLFKQTLKLPSEIKQMNHKPEEICWLNRMKLET